MDDNLGCAGYLVLIVVGIGLWFWLGDPGRDVRRLLNQETSEDRVKAVADMLKGKPIGGSGDIWLVKGNWGAPDRTALIFGYLDDFEFCYEIAQLYMERYPLDSYHCENAN